MRKSVLKPVAMIMLFVLVVSTACSLFSGGTPTATAVPTQAATSKPTIAPASSTLSVSPTQATSPMANSSGGVSSLDSVQSATIQIQSEGTFVDPEVGLQVNSAGRGSGFFINSDGLAITNNHVVTGAALLRVWIGGNSQKEYDARVVGVSECSDLAVIKVDGSNFPYLKWAADEPKVGLPIYAAGFPLGEPEFSLTQGIVSKTAEPGATSWASVANVLTHTATLNPGNSGGPLVNEKGQVVGINYAANNANQYFAIGKTEADKVLKDLEAGKDVTSIGINGEAVTGTLSDGSAISGIWVSSVKSGSPADKAGIQAGDIVYQMEGEVLATDGTMETYCKILRSHLSTDTLSISVLRYSTGQMLTGELNGRQLAVSTSFFSNQLSSQAPTASGSSSNSTYSEYTTVTDDTNSIKVDVPTKWTDTDTSSWSTTWTLENGSTYSFTAPSIAASTDLSTFYDGYDNPGVFFAASSDWAKIGGYIELLDGIKGWFQNDCTLDGTYDYSDSLYQGKYDLWTNCGTNKTMVVALSARPINNPYGYLILVEVKIVSDADLDALDQILSSFVLLK